MIHDIFILSIWIQDTLKNYNYYVILNKNYYYLLQFYNKSSVYIMLNIF